MGLRSGIKEKLFTVPQADAWVHAQRAAGLRIGFTCGAFDVLHAGHVQYLEDARGLCDRLLVAVNSDQSVRASKGPLRPVNPWAERAYVVAGLESCDGVTVLEEARPLALIQRWKPDLYIKGGDYATRELRSRPVVEEYGGRTVVIPSRFGSSTTAMFERVQALAALAAPADAAAREPRGLALIDLDGTLIRDGGFDPSRAELLPGVVEALRELQSAGFRLCVVTNQQGIGLGYFGYRDFVDQVRRVLRALGGQGIAIARIYFCPHSVGEPCECRKPAPGLIARAMGEQGIPASRCFVIGDSVQDMEAAEAAGCRGIYVGPGRPGYAAVSITEAARQIIETAAAL